MATSQKVLRNKGTKNSYWLGGYYGNDKNWHWVTNETFSYTNWGRYQPDYAYGRENCLMVYKDTANGWALGDWNDLAENGRCDPDRINFFGIEHFGFICEWDNIRNIRNINHNPQGALEAYGTGVGLLRVVGWALDEDDLNHKVRVHVYVGGTAGNSSVPQFQIIADKDHNKHSGHGFDDTVSIPFSLNGIDYKGFKTIYLYALNDVGEGTWQEIGSLKVFLQYKDIAKQQVTAYMDSALTRKNGTEYVDAGDEVTVVDESENAYKVIYPLRQGGTKERWVNKHELFTESKVAPVDDDSIPTKLQELIDKWDGQKWSDGYSRSSRSEKYLNSSAIQCKEFASYVFNILYDTGYVGGGSSESNYYNWRLNNVPNRVVKVDEVPETLNSSIAREAFKNLFQNAKPGDFIQIKRGHGGAHSAIFVRHTPNGIAWFDANADGANGIKLQIYSYDDLVKTIIPESGTNARKKFPNGYQWNVAMSIYRAR